MSDSDNARRGRFYRGGAEKVLCRKYNRAGRRRAQGEIRNAAGFLDDELIEDADPLNQQHRHGGLWDAS